MSAIDLDGCPARPFGHQQDAPRHRCSFFFGKVHARFHASHLMPNATLHFEIKWPQMKTTTTTTTTLLTDCNRMCIGSLSLHICTYQIISVGWQRQYLHRALRATCDDHHTVVCLLPFPFHNVFAPLCICAFFVESPSVARRRPKRNHPPNFSRSIAERIHSRTVERTSV